MATVALSGIITPTNVVTATSTSTLSNKTLVAPALGTPTSGVLTSCTGLNYDGFKNRIINGAMVIDQRNAGASVTLTSGGVFLTDRFICYSNNDGVMTGQQDTSAPSGFINSIKFTTTTADSSLAATQYAEIQQIIEGLNISDLAWGTASAATVTLSFWVRSSLTGAFGGAIRNSANNRSYAFSYSISTANTWEQKSVTIAGDTSGTWLTTNGIGLKLCFGMGTGSTYSGTANVWTASVLVQPTGATSVVGTLNATWAVTGVQLEKGSTATSFDYRPYGTEFALCQRYYQQLNSVGGYNSIFGSGCFDTTTEIKIYTALKVTMRATPTTSVSSSSDFYAQATNGGGATSSFSAAYATSDSIGIGFTVTVSTATGTVLRDNNTTNAKIKITSEL